MARPWNCLLGRVNWGYAIAIFFALLTWFMAYASAQEPAPDAHPGRVIERLYPSPDVLDTWEKVVSCAGDKRDTTKTLDELKFFLREPGLLTAGGRLMKAEWVAPDTIYITQGFEHIGRVVAHEMLHHALNGPPGEDKHPLIPFMFPCGLLDFQQYQGGINDERRSAQGSVERTRVESQVAALKPVVPGTELGPGKWVQRYYVSDPLTNRIYR